ncbi:MAG: class I mannose-6-phosphate isomerase [Acidobacteriaceae bacterium]
MYDRFPCVEAGSASECLTGWARIGAHLRERVGARGNLVVECYPGVHLAEVERGLRQALPEACFIDANALLRSPEEIGAMLEPVLGDDPVFGRMNTIEIAAFLDAENLAEAQKQCAQDDAAVVVIGTGASLVCPAPDVLVYADLARWEIQMRQRRREIGNFGAHNLEETPSLKYKRSFFVDWRSADRLKMRLFERIDVLLDTNRAGQPKAISGEVFRRSLRDVVRRPFRVVPFFDPGPWGGHWMERVCGVPAGDAPNHAWCFDCVPEENSLLLGFGAERVEVPSINLVLAHPQELLGKGIVERFGAEFPIRFDFLDTVGGGNLSLQVHPLPSFIREHFGMDYTQDESYYMLDAEPGACVYLGLKEGVDKSAMLRDLHRAQDEDFDFPAEQFVNRFAAKKHDHFLIPAGTVHCSGKDSMVLEISATPYIFTFKLWDWGRVGLDGRPRPIHLRYGEANIQWNRTTEWVRKSLINRVEATASGKGWREERTGLHELEFIETRRHWFTGTVPHDTNGTVHVLNLIEGDAAMVESPTSAFAPFVVHYAETFIIPAAVGRYSIRPCTPNPARELGTIQARVRV